MKFNRKKQQQQRVQGYTFELLQLCSAAEHNIANIYKESGNIMPDQLMYMFIFSVFHSNLLLKQKSSRVKYVFLPSMVVVSKQIR